MGEGTNLNVPPVKGASTARSGGAVVVRLVGELDLYNAPEVRTAPPRALRPSSRNGSSSTSPRWTFVDSTALGVLIEARTTLANRQSFLLAVAGTGDPPRPQDLRASTSISACTTRSRMRSRPRWLTSRAPLTTWLRREHAGPGDDFARRGFSGYGAASRARRRTASFRPRVVTGRPRRAGTPSAFREHCRTLAQASGR